MGCTRVACTIERRYVGGAAGASVGPREGAAVCTVFERGEGWVPSVGTAVGDRCESKV